MADVEKIFSGPGIFVWGIDDAGAEEVDAITFDLTQGGITFTTTTTYYEPTTDQTGTAPIKSIKTGTTGNVAFESPEIDYAKIVAFDTDVTVTTDSVDATSKKYQVTGLAGQSLPTKRAVIKPQGVNDPNRYIYLEKCALKFDANFGFLIDNNLRMPVNGMCYPDLDATPKGLLYTWGDLTATA